MIQNLLAQYISDGLSQREIAKKEKCSQSTVKYYLKKYELKTLKSTKKIGVCTCCGETINEGNASNRGYNKKCFTVCKKCHYKRRIKRYQDNKRKAIEYKGGKCIHCGYNKCDASLDFHHRNPEEKDPQWKHMRSWSISKIKVELDKCDLVCSNCHGEIHWGRSEPGSRNNGIVE